MINLELKYYDTHPFSDEINVVYKRTFNIDYLNIDRKLQITDFEFKTITNLNRINLCDTTYQIISSEFKIDTDDNYWVLQVQNYQEIQERIDLEYEDLPF